ncbi:MAG: GSCFA domain-containing protein, partial [Flavitalea sp.]
AHDFLKEARWLIITLGSSFSYRLNDGNIPVANCHRAPASQFEKRLMTVEEINTALDNCLYRLFRFNANLQVIFTVSPVRHIRDGVTDNNRSKARLIESVHHLVNKFERLHYFPAYELVIDVLRDYRFYDIDLVHPNYQATQFVIEKFMEYFVNEPSKILSQEIQKIMIARKHKPFEASTGAHKKFLQLHAEKTRALMEKYPFLDLSEEAGFFEGHGKSF